MADPTGVQSADLARQRADAAAASKALAQDAANRAVAAAALAQAQQEAVSALLTQTQAAVRQVMGLRDQARAAQLQAAEILVSVQTLFENLNASAVQYDDSNTNLGAANLAQAIAALLALIRDGAGNPRPPDGAAFDFSKPGNLTRFNAFL